MKGEGGREERKGGREGGRKEEGEGGKEGRREGREGGRGGREGGGKEGGEGRRRVDDLNRCFKWTHTHTTHTTHTYSVSIAIFGSKYRTQSSKLSLMPSPGTTEAGTL